MKVWPTNTDARKHLRHPLGGPFRAEGHMDWPDDTFTARRIADGDVTAVDPMPEVSAVSPSAPRPDIHVKGNQSALPEDRLLEDKFVKPLLSETEYVDHTMPPVKKPEPKKSKGE